VLPSHLAADDRPRFARTPTEFLAHLKEKDLGTC